MANIRLTMTVTINNKKYRVITTGLTHGQSAPIITTIYSDSLLIYTMKSHFQDNVTLADLKNEQMFTIKDAFPS